MTDIKVKCDKCGTINTIPASDVDLQQIGGQERQMGPEIEFEGVVEINCTKCGAEIIYTERLWEYPVGVENHSEVEVQGGEVV